MRIAYFGRLVRIGNSKGMTMPREIQTIIGAKQGDMLRIEVEVVPLDANLHDDTTAPDNA